MEETSLRKCENCGGSLQALDADTLKCPYCGCTYSSKRAEQPLASGSRPPTNEVKSQASPGDSDRQVNSPANNNNLARIFLFLLLFVVAVVVISLVANASHGGNSADSSAADSLKGDMADTTLNILSDEDKKEAHEPHIKKTNPDPEILITQHRIGMDDGTKAMFIGYRNKSNHMIDNVQFNIQLFDRQGREIAIPDSEKTVGLYKGAGPGESDSGDWSLEHPQAKTVKVTLKKVALDSVVWDY